MRKLPKKKPKRLTVYLLIDDIEGSSYILGVYLSREDASVARIRKRSLNPYIIEKKVRGI